MLVEYFRFQLGVETRYGYFNHTPGHQFYSVWLFSLVEKISDRNDPAYVTEKPQMRYVPEVILEIFNTYAVNLDVDKQPIYVVHKAYFEDESLTFQHGMDGIFAIGSKMVNADGETVVIDKSEIPLSTLESSLTEGLVNHSVCGGPSSFIDDQFDLYHFRNRLAKHFAEALSGGKDKRSFQFEVHCQPTHFHELVLQKPNPHVEILNAKFRGHDGEVMFTHDSIFKIVSPSTEAVVKFETVESLFNFIGSFLNFWPLTSSKNYTTGGFRDFEFLALDGFNMNLRFDFDYRTRRLRVSGKFLLISFDAAFGSEAQSTLMIQSLEDKLCDDAPFRDEESGTNYVVVAVKRNSDPDLVVKINHSMSQ